MHKRISFVSELWHVWSCVLGCVCLCSVWSLLSGLALFIEMTFPLHAMPILVCLRLCLCVCVFVCASEMRQGQRVHSAAVLSISFATPLPLTRSASLLPSASISLSHSLPLSHLYFFPCESVSFPLNDLSAFVDAVHLSLSISHTVWGWCTVCMQPPAALC